MPPKSKSAEAKQRRYRSLEERLQIVKRAFNREQTGETIAQISKDVEASESIIYMLMNRVNEGLPLDPRDPKSVVDKAQLGIEDEPATSLVAEQPPMPQRQLSFGQNRSIKASVSVEHHEDELPPEIELVFLRRRVRQLENALRAFLN